jgi:hypothetical protein
MKIEISIGNNRPVDAINTILDTPIMKINPAVSKYLEDWIENDEEREYTFREFLSAIDSAFDRSECFCIVMETLLDEVMKSESN